MPTAANTYSIRRKYLLADIRFWRARGHSKRGLHQLRMELATHRICRETR